MVFGFTLETNASSRVEGLNMALVGSLRNMKLMSLFLELEKRVVSQEEKQRKT